MSLLIPSAIGVGLERTLAVRLLDFVRRRVRRDVEHLVIINHRQQEAADEAQRIACLTNPQNLCNRSL
jgi:hypothetical protein